MHLSFPINFAGEEICFNTEISSLENGPDSEWKLGTCGGTVKSHKDGRPNFYIQRCCLKAGKYTLTCVNRKNPYGWGQGYIEIQGHRYCNDFMSYRMMQKITIRSNY